MRASRHYFAPDMQAETYRRRDVALLYVFALTELGLSVPKNVIRSSRAGTYSPSDHSDALGDLVEAHGQKLFDELLGYDPEDVEGSNESRVERAKLLLWWEENRSSHAKSKYERASKQARAGK